MKTRQILDTIANEYNQYSMARGYYKAIDKGSDRNKCELCMATLTMLANNLDVKYKTDIVEDEANGTPFTWYKITIN